MKVLLLSITIALAVSYLRSYYQFQMDNDLQRDGYHVSDIYDFEMYEREFGKSYDDAFSKRHRMDIYLRNKKRIEVFGRFSPISLGEQFGAWKREMGNQ